VPGREPHEHLTTIDIESAGDRTNVVIALDALHDQAWTQQHRALDVLGHSGQPEWALHDADLRADRNEPGHYPAPVHPRRAPTAT
jgi:hypothetical protein